MYEADPKSVFNCVQRGHQNYLEGLPGFLLTLGIAGVQFPLISSALGVIYLAGRIVYAIGYSTGIPENRHRGSFGYIGALGLLGMSIYVSVKMTGLLPARW